MSKPIMEKFLNGEKLTEEDRYNLVWGSLDDEGYEYVDQIDGSAGRWMRKMQTVFKYNGEYWAIDWRSGLTELQENEYPSNPYRVERKERVVTVVDWVRV
nr:MAG TPA: hypothetical protein [Caudoviricetes sp.]